MTHRHNVYELLGVSGPGDAFTSSGPHGESSLAAQAKDHGPDEPDAALSGGAAMAAEQVVENVFDDFGQIQHGEMVEPSHGGGGGGFAAAPAPASFPGDSALPSKPSGSSTTLLAVAAALVGVFLVWK